MEFSGVQLSQVVMVEYSSVGRVELSKVVMVQNSCVGAVEYTFLEL